MFDALELYIQLRWRVNLAPDKYRSLQCGWELSTLKFVVFLVCIMRKVGSDASLCTGFYLTEIHEIPMIPSRDLRGLPEST